MATGQEILSLTEHTNFTGAVAVSPDGQFIASASTNEVKLWDGSTDVDGE